MNERIRELAEQAGITTNLDTDHFEKDPNKWVDYFAEKFAESIIQDCLNMCDWETGQRIQKHFQYRDNRWPETEQNPIPF